jgi:hypothetical protein
MIILEHEDYKVIKIEPKMVDAAIPLITPLLSLSIPYTSEFSSLGDLIEAMKQGARPWQLWVILKKDAVVGGFITTLERAGNDLLVNFEILDGIEAKEWIWPLVEKFETYMAFMYNCTGSRIIGRKGWEKFLRNYGYVPTHFITTKKFLPKVLEAPFEQKKIGVNNGEL